MLLALVVSASTTGAVLADSHLVQVAVAERGDATVERIRRDLENAFLLTRILATGNGAGSFSLGGPLRITDLRDSQSDYRVYLPQVVWNDAQSDLRAQLGNITIDVEVLSETRLQFAVALPKAFFVRDVNEQVTHHVLSQAQSLVGVWDNEILSFTALDGALSKVSVQSSLDRSRFGVDEFIVHSEIRESGPDSLDYNYQIDARGIALAIDAGATLQLGALANSGATRGIDKTALIDLQHTVLALAEQGADSQDLLIAQFDPFARPFDSGEVRFELDDLHIDTLESQIDVPTLSITVNMGSFGRGKATWLALDYGHRGLNVAARGANTG